MLNRQSLDHWWPLLTLGFSGHFHLAHTRDFLMVIANPTDLKHSWLTVLHENWKNGLVVVADR
jgi:hypothetical protein